MRNKLTLIAGAIAALALAQPAVAAQTMTLSGIDAYGFTATAPQGWLVKDNWDYEQCSAIGYDSQTVVAQGEIDAWDVDGVPSRSVRIAWWDYEPSVSRIEVSCELVRYAYRYERRWRYHTKGRAGTDTSSRSKSGNCYFRNWGGGELQVDCWGGSYATARYRFRVPDGARRVSRWIRGEAGCCDRGQIIRSWSGNTATVTVTNWRSYYIERVGVRYQTRDRVRVRTVVRDTGYGYYG